MNELASLGSITLSFAGVSLIDRFIILTAVVLTDAAVLLLWLTVNWEKISGVQRRDIEGRNVRILVREGYYSIHRWAQALSEGQAVTSLVRFAKRGRSLGFGSARYGRTNVIKLVYL